MNQNPSGKRYTSYKEFAQRFDLLQNSPETRRKFRLLQRTKITQICLTVDAIPLHMWTLRALTKLNCKTALHAIMLTPEEMFSGTGLGEVGFTELQTWFMQTCGLNPWPEVNPRHIYSKLYQQKREKKMPSADLPWWHSGKR